MTHLQLRSSAWKSVSADQRKTLLEDGVKEDGEFWMSIEDMTKHFTNFEVCSVSVDTLTEDDSGICTHIHSQKHYALFHPCS